MVQRRRVGRLVLALSTSLLAVVTFVPSANPALSATGLVAGYAFNEGSGTSAANAAGSGLVGTLTGGATWGAGRNAGAVLLDGADDYVELGNPAALQLTGSMTVSAWVNSAAFPVDDAAIVSKRSSIGYQLDTTIDSGPRTVGFKLTNGSGGSVYRYGATTLQANAWYHVAGVYNATTSELHVYVNGQLDDATLLGTVTSTQQNSTANVNIGRRPTGNGYNFNGRLDDVRIYGRALTLAEIQADMNTPVTGSPGGDSQVPSVSISSPASNAQVNDIVNVTANASDNVGVVGVQFLVDGANVGVEDATSPYALAWDTRTVANGAHTLTARARDAAGNSTLSAPVPVNVTNSNSFQNEVLATGFNLPTNIEFLPDGRMLVVEFAGTIKVVPPPYVQADPTPFLQLTNIAPTGSAVDRGVIDLELDPQFATNRYYYIFYTAETPTRDRLSRFTANASLTGTIAGSEVVLYQDTQDTTSASQSHHGGAIAFGGDGKIYFTTGDHFQGSPSQSLTSPRGKMHRINPDGTIPTDNPFYDGNGPNVDSIWAIGLRNPYRTYYDAPTGRLYIGDVGGNDNSTSQEEVNVNTRGANYGWPNDEGVSSNPAYTNPIYSYPHNGRDASITGGFVYHGTQFPSSYQGSYFFADYTQNWIKRMTFDASGNVTGVFNFEPANGSSDGPYGDIVHLTEGPDGALYYVDIGYSDVGGTFGVSKLRRISFSSGNQAPIAVGAANPTAGPAPLVVNFSSAGSSDPEGQPLTYSWTFGDNTTSTIANPSHTYSQSGQYSARLSVSDGVRTTISTPISISVGSPPTATILSPQDGIFFVAGDVISFSGSGTDPDDGTLPASAFSWNIDFLHEGHVHPGGSITGVTSGTFTIPTSGHDFSGNTRYRITLTVTDSTGLSGTRSVLIYPRKVNLSFSSAPTGLTLYLDGVAKTTPFVYDTLNGFSHTVEARNQALGATSYVFGSWSDGGAQTHTIVVPAVDQSYAATFQASAAPPAIAGYAFNEGSGTSAANAAGGGLVGTLTGGATWGAGRNAGSVLLDGADDYVELGNPAALQLTGSMTVSAWVNSAAFPGDDAAIVSKRSSIGYQLDTTIDSGPRTVGFKLTNGSGGSVYRYGATTLQANAWYHVAGVYNAATSELHVYVNGQLDDATLLGTVTSTQQNSTANVNIGRRPTGNGYNFNGRLDDVRIYGRALTLAEIQADMNTPVAGGSGDATPPTAPGSLSATATSSTQVNLSWSAATDNVAVTGYRVERCQGAGCSIFVEIAQPTATTFSDSGRSASTSYSYRVRAVDAAANLGPYSGTATATTPASADSQPPTAPGSLSATAASSTQVNLSWSAATDNVAVTGYRVERCQGAGCSIFVEIAQPTATTFSDSGRSASTSYSYRVRAVDAAANLGPYSGTATATTPASTAGLVAGYAFNEGSGTSAANAAGSGLVGTLTNGATWGAGRNGGAVRLDGANDYVELGNPTALQFTGSMTVSAWVNSAAFPVDDAAIVSKRSNGEVGYQLDTTVDRGPRTVGFKLTNSAGGTMVRYGATTLLANTWYHVSGVYNAATSELHVYVNGQLDDATLLGTVTSTQRNSTVNVNIGRRPTGNSFNLNGRLDDVRIYGRALTLAEIQADMNTAVV